MSHKHHDDHAHHSHSLSRSEELEAIGDRRLLLAIVLNQLLTIGEFAAGLLSGSIALISDAVHNFNDANALLIAYIARRVSRKKSNQQFTFGYRRAEMIGALINLTLLASIGVFLVFEGIMRFFEPVAILGWLMAIASIVALVIDAFTAWLLWSMSHGSLNARAAFIHNLVDAFGSLAVLLGAIVIIFFGWTWIDPVLTLLIAGYILWQVYLMLPKAIRVLMQGTPEGLNLDELVNSLQTIEHVVEIHHVHAWELDTNMRTLEAHVVVDEASLKQMEYVKKEIKHRLADEFEIHHSTLEFEINGSDHNGCSESSVISDH